MTTTTTTTTTTFRSGDRVTFGRPNGAKTHGTVRTVSAKSVTIITTEERGAGRGSTVGKAWRVHPSFVTLVAQVAQGENPAQATLDYEEAKRTFVRAAGNHGLVSPVTEAAFEAMARACRRTVIAR